MNPWKTCRKRLFPSWWIRRRLTENCLRSTKEQWKVFCPNNDKRTNMKRITTRVKQKRYTKIGKSSELPTSLNSTRKASINLRLQSKMGKTTTGTRTIKTKTKMNISTPKVLKKGHTERRMSITMRFFKGRSQISIEKGSRVETTEIAVIATDLSTRAVRVALARVKVVLMGEKGTSATNRSTKVNHSTETSLKTDFQIIPYSMQYLNYKL